MKNKIVFRYLGKVLVGFSLLFILPLLVCLIYKENVLPFIIPMVLSLGIGLLLNLLDSKKEKIFAKDGFVIVALSWIAISVIGAIPFYLNGDLSYIDALFETVSGFTTTGASVITDVEVLNKSILFWRSFSHFIGGMGVLAFVMAIIPLSHNDKSMHLLKAEMPGPSVSKLVPTIKKTLLYLYGIYIGLTTMLIILLLVGGMNILDSMLIAFGTAGTGGFSVLNSSLATYSTFNKIVVAIFMFLFGINFNIYFLLLIKDIKSIFKSEELRVYIGLYICAVIVVLINTVNYFGNFGSALLEATFHVSSLMTSTGYSIGDINIYGTYARIVILFLMIVSACAGSTCGGFKIARLIIVAKSIKRDIIKIVHPNAVQTITFEGKIVTEDVVKSTNTFLLLYLVLLLLFMFLISLNGFSLEVTINAVFTTFANVGLCFNISNFSEFSDFSKIVLSIGMLFGRLEIFPMLILFSNLGRKNK